MLGSNLLDVVKKMGLEVTGGESAAPSRHIIAKTYEELGCKLDSRNDVDSGRKWSSSVNSVCSNRHQVPSWERRTHFFVKKKWTPWPAALMDIDRCFTWRVLSGVKRP